MHRIKESFIYFSVISMDNLTWVNPSSAFSLWDIPAARRAWKAELAKCESEKNTDPS